MADVFVALVTVQYAPRYLYVADVVRGVVLVAVVVAFNCISAFVVDVRVVEIVIVQYDC